MQITSDPDEAARAPVGGAIVADAGLALTALADACGESDRTTPGEPLPELSEPELVRHFTALADRTFGVDTGFYPLWSCTMKHNPRVNEVVVRLPGFADLHPLQEEDGAQGALELMWRLQEILA